MAEILVVDDDPAARLLLRTLAEHAGHGVHEAENGARGYEIALESTPDLVIIDLSMPQISGPEFVRMLRTDKRTARTRIALYTATSRTPAIDDFVEMYGLCAVLPKPSEPAELLAAIDAALRAPLPVRDLG
jgi:CheY-like chemotaxis protein